MSAANRSEKTCVNVLASPPRIGPGSGTSKTPAPTELTDPGVGQPGDRLRASDVRLRVLLQSLPDYAILTLDATGHITDWTEGAEHVYGYRADEVEGQHLALLYPAEQVASGEVDTELLEATQKGRAEREALRVRKGGQRFWGNEIATAMRDQHGQLIGFAKICRDLTERKQMQDALRASEEHHRLLIESAREFAIFMTDPEGRVTTWNPGAERIFGHRAEEIINHPISILFTAADRESGVPEKEMTTAARTGRASDDRWQVRRDGTLFWASGITSSMRDAAGELRGFTKVLRDLTEQKGLEEERQLLLEREQAARAAAERAMVLRDEFLAVVTHELRTPLAAILLWSKLLRTGAVPPEEQPAALEAIERGAVAQQHLIEDLLDVSRLMSGKLRLERREVDLGSLVRTAIEDVRPSAEAKSVTVTLTSADQPHPASVDRDRIQQVIWNLLSNAVKFTGPGGRVEVAITALDDRTRIDVSDTGVGISAEFLPEVFDRFRQADASTTRAEGGLGLGLAISKQLVEAHGGEISADSAGEGQGATFTLELPRGGADDAPLTPDLPASVPALGRLRGRRILLVEDDGGTRAAAATTLHHHGAEVVATGSAAEALALYGDSLRGRAFDLLLTDVGMPLKDGYSLLRDVRELERAHGRAAVPAVVFTAYTRNEDRAHAVAAGFAAHIRKPVEPAALVATLTEVLNAD